jgi:uncharacterized Fe-S cluster protein YjdI
MDKKGSFTGERKYSNGEITVYWKPNACVHASYCYRELIEVFDPGRRPWVDMKAASTERIIEVVDMCPTPALTWKWNDEEKNKSVSSENTNHIKFRRPELIEADKIPVREIRATVKVMTDGPIVIKGSFTLAYNGARKEMNETLVSICRCGKSDHLPFCDGQHRKTGFTD